MGDAREIAGLLRSSAALIHDSKPTVRSRLMQRAADMLDRLDNVDEQVESVIHEAGRLDTLACWYAHETARLREALGVYGQHLGGCLHWVTSKCDCGYTELLSAVHPPQVSDCTHPELGDECDDFDCPRHGANPATAPAPGSRCTGTVRMIEPQPIVVTCDDPTCPEHGRCTCTHRGTPWHAANTDPFCAVHGRCTGHHGGGSPPCPIHPLAATDPALDC